MELDNTVYVPFELVFSSFFYLCFGSPCGIVSVWILSSETQLKDVLLLLLGMESMAPDKR